MDWSVQELRATWFAASVDNVSASDLYVAAFGTDADQITKNKVPNPGQPFLSRAEASVDGHMKQIVVQPGRVDMFARVAQPDGSPPPISIGGIDQLDAFTAGVEKLCGIVGQVTRIAFAPVLVWQAENAEEVGRGIQRLVFGALPLPDARDVSFQINQRKRFAAVPLEEMNRVCRLDSLMTQWFVVQSGQQIVFPAPSSSQDRHFIAFTLDTNSTPRGYELDAETQQKMFREMSSEIISIGASHNIIEYLSK